jgi:zinc and cadmium transporter
MSPLFWILASGLAMSAISLVGSLVLLLPEPIRRGLVTPLVAFAAGSLLGGALLNLLPAAIERDPTFAPFLWLVAGFLAFYALEQVLLVHHHPHEGDDDHVHGNHPVIWLVLLADALHNLLGGVSVAAAFLIDARLGMTVWLAEAAHEVPQELGDFMVLVHAGLTPRRALVYNLLSGLTFPLGGLIAWGLATHVDLSFLLAFGAGNFLYIAAADLVPEIGRKPGTAAKIRHFAAMLAGLGVLLAIRMLLPE